MNFCEREIAMKLLVIRYFLLVPLCFIGACASVDRFHALELIANNSPSDLKVKADNNDSWAILAYSIVLRQGIKGEIKNIEMSDYYRQLVTDAYHDEAVGTNGGIVFVGKRNIDDNIIRINEYCASKINFDEPSVFSLKICGDL